MSEMRIEALLRFVWKAATGSPEPQVTSPTGSWGDYTKAREKIRAASQAAREERDREWREAFEDNECGRTPEQTAAGVVSLLETVGKAARRAALEEFADKLPKCIVLEGGRDDIERAQKVARRIARGEQLRPFEGSARAKGDE